MQVKKQLRRPYVKPTLKVMIGGTLGYYLFWLTSHPTKSPLRRRLPEREYKNLSYLPEIKVRRRGKEYHLHHWMNLSLLYLLLLFIRRGYFKSYMLQAFLLGSILQGLTYKDRFKIVNPVAPVTAVDEE